MNAIKSSRIVIFLLFYAQLYILLEGILYFDKLTKPFVLLAISLLIPYLYAINIFKKDSVDIAENKQPRNFFYGLVLGGLSISLLYYKFRQGFVQFADYRSMSDVIMQLETLYERFSNGIFPYSPVEYYPWHPYPVYMPLNWLPIGLAKVFQCDVRWIGVLFLAIATGIWGIFVFTKQQNLLNKIVALLLPSIAMLGFLHWDMISIAVTYEVLIAAYYLILATGLALKNLPLTLTGIIVCILSRYTMIFWLPAFLYLLWYNTPKKTNFILWGVLLASILFLYLVPFYLKDPSIFTLGLAYHNHCYVEGWNGLGNPEESTSFDQGLTFSWFICEGTSGPMEQRVLIARVIQGIVQMLVLILGLAFYKRLKDKVNFYDYALLLLYVQLLTFFMFSPFSYMYYYLPFLMVSAVLCGKIILQCNSVSLSGKPHLHTGTK